VIKSPIYDEAPRTSLALKALNSGEEAEPEPSAPGEPEYRGTLVIPVYRHESLDNAAPSPEESSGLSTVDTHDEVVMRWREPP